MKAKKLSFHASHHLPVVSMGIILRLHVPAMLMAWARSCRSKKFPARGFFQTTRVNAYRGHECHFPPHTSNEVEFLATADALAKELESGASFDVEVIHDDRNRGHQLLGRAKVPLAVLVGESWVEGSAPVFSVPGEAFGDVTIPETSVQLGSLNLLLSIQDLQEEQPPAPSQPAELNTLPSTSPNSGAMDKGNRVHSRSLSLENGPPASTQPSTDTNGATSAPNAPSVEGRHSSAHAQGMKPYIDHHPDIQHHTVQNAWQGAQKDHVQHHPPHQNQAQVSNFLPPYGAQNIEATVHDVHALAIGRITTQSDAQSHSLDAWNVHGSVSGSQAGSGMARLSSHWRKDQEDAFTAGRAAVLAQRRSILETEWSTQNARRAAESEQCLKRLAATEGRLAKELADVEARASRLTSAEESSSKAADALDRAASRRRTDVEAAVRRLQAELQHALDIERSRNSEAAAGRDAAAAAATAARGAAAASARAAKELEENRKQSEASKLQWELAEANAEADAAERRAQEANEAKAALQQSASELAQKVQDTRTHTERIADEATATLRVKMEQSKMQAAATEHQRTLQQQERLLHDMMLKLHDLKSVQIAV